MEDLLEQAVIAPSISLWNLPVFLIPKKDGTKPVVDYRQFSKKCQQKQYPLPVMTDIVRWTTKYRLYYTELRDRLLASTFR